MAFAYVYIMASKRNGTLYTGVTSNLVQCVSQHKHGMFGGFTDKYGVSQLVWYEPFDDMNAAIQREKNIKAWQRAWNIRLSTEANPEWRDLFEEIAA